MHFGQALEILKKGGRVWRSGWNGKGMWLLLVTADQWGAFEGRADLGSLRALPWIGMKTADDGFVPWLASQTDLLAEDWSSNISV